VYNTSDLKLGFYTYMDVRYILKKSRKALDIVHGAGGQGTLGAPWNAPRQCISYHNSFHS